MSTTFSDFDFYQEHGGRLSEAEYKAVVDDAHAEILSQTNGSALSAPTDMLRAIKLCECRLVDVIEAYRTAEEFIPKGVGSVTNDKLSISAGTESPQKAENRERKAVCVRYLQWPVNLMNRWI